MKHSSPKSKRILLIDEYRKWILPIETYSTIWYWPKQKPKRNRLKSNRKPELRLLNILLNLYKITKFTWRRIPKKLQTTVSETEHTVATEHENLIHRTHISGPISATRKKTAPQIGGKTTPKNRHCLCGVDLKYIQWNEILSYILNGKLKVLQNRIRKTETASDSENGKIEDQDESDFEMEDQDTSETNGYKRIMTNPEDELNLHNWRRKSNRVV